MTIKKRTLGEPEAEPGSAEPSAPDVALIHGITPDGGLRILRAKGDRIELGAVRPLREGVPITGEVVKLRPRENCPIVCDVEVQLEAKALPNDRQLKNSEAEPSLARSGPAQVATDEYRKNWDTIWSRSRASSKLVN